MSSAYIGKTCPYCQFPLKSESIIAVCSNCSMPHHIECWRENDGCSTLGCNGDLYQEERPSETDISMQFEEGTVPLHPDHLLPGTVLQNRYRLGKALGQGDYGITYLAMDNNLDLLVALKEYYPKNLVARSAENAGVVSVNEERENDFNCGLELFIEEAKKLARLPVHPNLVSIKDLFQHNGTVYMVMNYFDGISLEKYLLNNGGRLPFDEVKAMLNPILDVLQLIHDNNLLHLDISPRAILVDRADKLLLINFGTAKYSFCEKLGNLSEVINSGFVPVEQYLSKGKKGPWSDIYAYAATLYCCITGQSPPEVFDRMDESILLTPTALSVKVEHRQEKVLLKALAIDASERYRKVADFQRDLSTHHKSSSDLMEFTGDNLAALRNSNFAKTLKDRWVSFCGWLNNDY